MEKSVQSASYEKFVLYILVNKNIYVINKFFIIYIFFLKKMLLDWCMIMF